MIRTLIGTAILSGTSMLPSISLFAREFNQIDPAFIQVTNPSTDAATSEAKKQSPEEAYQEARRILKSKPDEEQTRIAYQLTKDAVAQGHADAHSIMGYFYFNGLVVKKNPVEALEWFRKGAEAGGPAAQLNYGRMLASGGGGRSNHADGVSWIRKAADQNLPDALGTMGDIYFSGKYGVEKDHKRAFEFHRKAADLNDPISQNMIGVYYRDGVGVEIDAKEARKWFTKAAEQNDPKGQSNLGHIIGVEGEEKVEGLTWLLVAQANGEPLADATVRELIDRLDTKLVDAARKKMLNFRPTEPGK